MTPVSRAALAMLVLTLIAATAGGWVGVHYGSNPTRSSASLDDLLHHELKLTADQGERISVMEQQFAARRRTLEDKMRAANRELATAIVSEHRYGPQAHQAIEDFHAAMASLQEETIQHVLAMRAVLTPVQAQQFDKTVAQALNSDQP
jgi:Spy/CpxP family protein refolding chaperone